MALAFADLGDRIVRTECWPMSSKVGKLVQLWKGKGQRDVCDASRGLILSDHSSKMFAGILKEEIEPKYVENVPAS